MLCSQNLYQIQYISFKKNIPFKFQYISKRKTWANQAAIPHLHPQPLGTTRLLSIFVDFAVLDTSYNGIIQYVVFCFWLHSLHTMCSRFICVVAYVSTALLLRAA